MAAATTIDLVVNQKASFQVYFIVKDSTGAVLNLTNYTTAAKFKENYQTTDNLAIAFTSAVSNSSAGEISIALSPAQTTAMQVGKYVYDVSITDNSGYKMRICEGRILVSGGVS